MHDRTVIRFPRERRPPLILASRWGSSHTLEPPTGATPLHERGVSGCSDRRMGFPRRPPSLTILRHLSTDEPTPLTTTDRTHSPSAPQTPGRPQQCPLNVSNRSICVTGRATVFHRSGRSSTNYRATLKRHSITRATGRLLPKRLKSLNVQTTFLSAVTSTSCGFSGPA